MEYRRRQLMGACAGTLAISSFPRVVSATAAAPLLLYIDIDAPGSVAGYKTFMGIFQRRFAATRAPPQVRFITAVPEEGDKNSRELKEAIVAQRPDIILAANPMIALMAGRLGLGIPILFFSLADPIAFGLTDSLTRPGLGMTGFTLGAASNLKRQEMLLRLVPRCRIVGQLANSGHQTEGLRKPPAASVAPPPGIEVRKFDCNDLEQLAALVKSREVRAVDAWDIEYIYVAFRYPEELVRYLATLNRPVMYPRMKHLRLGGMAAYEPSIAEADDAWVSQVASLLAGVPLENIPVVQATRYSFGLNLKACHRVGVNPSKSLIKIADVVIE